MKILKEQGHEKVPTGFPSMSQNICFKACTVEEFNCKNKQQLKKQVLISYISPICFPPPHNSLPSLRQKAKAQKRK